MTVETHALLATLTVLAVAVIVRLVRRQVLKAKYTVLWLTVGLVLAITASVPTLLDRVADLLGIWYQPTLFLLLAIGFLPPVHALLLRDVPDGEADQGSGRGVGSAPRAGRRPGRP